MLALIRQLVLEGFLDAAKVSGDHAFGDGPWFRSVGGDATVSLSFWAITISPGIEVSRQLDGDEKTVPSFVLRGIF